MIERLVETDAHEGPVYVAEGRALYFTTQRAGERVDIRRLDVASRRVTTVREDANVANGMTLAGDRRLLVCEQRPAAIALVDRTSGERETLVDSYRGRPLNSPNDVVVASDGSVWFTDPSYAHLQGFGPPPQLADHVYRHANGRLDAVAGGFDKPNGLAFSPDESVLYVGDSERRHVKAFDVIDGRLENERIFAEIGTGYPDGIKVDAAGNVYTTGGPGLQVFDPSGALVREISIAGAVNLAFGGDVLFVTADDAIWSVTLERSPNGHHP
jgi:gluconolactonase